MRLEWLLEVKIPMTAEMKRLVMHHIGRYCIPRRNDTFQSQASESQSLRERRKIHPFLQLPGDP